MKLRNTTLMLILWLTCQQAFAVVSTFPISTDFTPDEQISSHHHDDTADDAMHAKGNHSMHAESDHSSDVECCDAQCQCCIGGCQSVLQASMPPIL